MPSGKHGKIRHWKSTIWRSFCDVLFITVRRGDSYSKEGVYIAYGVREDGRREVLLLEINPTESAAMWGEFLEQAKARGLESADIIVADGLSGMEDVVHRLFPMAVNFGNKCPECFGII